jgi:vacuolar protein sorting-associated protein 45
MFLSNYRTRDIKDIIVFIIGGVTYEEARFIADLNGKGKLKVVLGGTFIHNSQRYVSNSTLKAE